MDQYAKRCRMRLLVFFISLQTIRGENIWSKMSSWSKDCLTMQCFHNQVVGYFQEKGYDDIELMPGVLLKRSTNPRPLENVNTSFLQGREITIKLMDTCRKNQSQGKKPGYVHFLNN